MEQPGSFIQHWQVLTSYTWTVSAGITITTGGTQASKTLTVTWNTTGAQTVSINYTNASGCTAASPIVLNITVNALPVPAITGPASVCIEYAGNVYTTQAGMTGYTWTVPPGATITSGATTKSIVISFGPAAGTGVITVNGTNACGNGPVSSNFNITMNAVPSAPVITANGAVLTSSVAGGNQWYYTGNAIAGATGQTYTVTHNTGYYWCVVTNNGCSSPISNKDWIVVTGRQELQGSNFIIFPVPNDGRFIVTVTSQVVETYTIIVYNQLGV